MIRTAIKYLFSSAQNLPKSPSLGPLEVKNPTVSQSYYWCSCGLSKQQPLCDGSHKGSTFKPYKFTLECETKKLELCGCKRTNKVPYCDGQTCTNLNKQ